MILQESHEVMLASYRASLENSLYEARKDEIAFHLDLQHSSGPSGETALHRERWELAKQRVQNLEKALEVVDSQE